LFNRSEWDHLPLPDEADRLLGLFHFGHGEGMLICRGGGLESGSPP
jgi:hypothetical protein